MGCLVLCSIVRVKDAEEVQRQALAMSIRSFTGENAFLSTMFKSKVVLPGEGASEEDFVAYPTVEHALQVGEALRRQRQ